MDTCIMDTICGYNNQNHGYMYHGHICMGHTAWAPEGREGQSQADPKGPKPTRRASKLLVHTYWHVYNVMIQMIQRCNLLSLDGCCPFHLSVTRDQGLLLIILVQFQEIRHLIWVFTAAKRIHRVFLFRTLMPLHPSITNLMKPENIWPPIIITVIIKHKTA